MQDTLLIEILTEELPPKSLQNLSAAFAQGVFGGLAQQGFLAAASQATAYATPRRLAVSVTGVAAVQPEREIERKGPMLASAFDAAGKPAPALLGFARSCGVAVEALQRGEDAKGAFFLFRTTHPGEALARHLPAIVEAALKKLPVARIMRWGDKDTQFVRPVHGLVMLHGEKIVPGAVLGLESGNRTLGHRFEAKAAPLVLKSADGYARQLRAEGAVIADFAERRAEIARQLAAVARTQNLTPITDDALLDEVTALVELPNVLAGKFESGFLAVPQECLILTMKANQKYFPLLDAQGKLTDKFLMVSNIRPADASLVIGGNERVIRPRLADAKFFFDQDRKKPLAARVPGLDKVVYHNRLGSQLQRVQRIQKLAGEIARRLGADAALTERAADLCKADLLTDMVGEFPELQGVMGRHYALHDGEHPAVARAIGEHYHPRFAGDTLPQDNIGAALALADKLDTLVGIYGIGLVPTGDKDPFGLRRCALGVLRILAEKTLPLDLLQLLQLARNQFPAEMLADSVTVDLHAFVLERLKAYLRAEDFLPDEIDAVVSQNPVRIDQVVPRLQAVRRFKQLPEAQALAVANKRIQNILKKTAAPDGQPDILLMVEPAEQALFEATQRLSPEVASLLGGSDYTDALCALARARRQVDTFFDEVMVMTDEPLLRNNRLALLRQLSNLMNQVADISRLTA